MSDDDEDDNTIEFKAKKDKPTATPAVDAINYPVLLSVAYRSVVREALNVISRHPDPGRFNISFTFDMSHPDVIVPNNIRGQHPNDITIVLNQQYSNLEVLETSFNVTVYFNKRPVPLTVPYAAIMLFHDEYADFTIGLGNTSKVETATIKLLEEVSDDVPCKIVSLDDFRKDRKND